MIFVDTNIFLEVFARTGAKSDNCLEFLENETNLWTSVLVLSEIEWVLRSGYQLDRPQVIRYLKRVVTMNNLVIEDHRLVLEALDHYQKTTADWFDCLNVARLQSLGINQLASYDKHFDSFGDISRIRS